MIFRSQSNLASSISLFSALPPKHLEHSLGRPIFLLCSSQCHVGFLPSSLFPCQVSSLECSFLLLLISRFCTFFGDLAHSISSENVLPAMLVFSFHWTHMTHMQLTLSCWIPFAFPCVPHPGRILTEGKDSLKFLCIS